MATLPLTATICCPWQPRDCPWTTEIPFAAEGTADIMLTAHRPDIEALGQRLREHFHDTHEHRAR